MCRGPSEVNTTWRAVGMPGRLSPEATRGSAWSSSVLAALAGGVVFAVLARVVRRPLRVFVPATAGVLALSMIPVLAVILTDPPPFPGTSPAAGVTLAIMHVVVAGVLLTALRCAQRSVFGRAATR